MVRMDDWTEKVQLALSLPGSFHAVEEGSWTPYPKAWYLLRKQVEFDVTSSMSSSFRSCHRIVSWTTFGQSGGRIPRNSKSRFFDLLPFIRREQLTIKINSCSFDMDHRTVNLSKSNLDDAVCSSKNADSITRGRIWAFRTFGKKSFDHNIAPARRQYVTTHSWIESQTGRAFCEVERNRQHLRHAYKPPLFHGASSSSIESMNSASVSSCHQGMSHSLATCWISKVYTYQYHSFQ